jgi:GH25 family lysozyme M1 (1,4-beta-N-acetylmuramidase)
MKLRSDGPDISYWQWPPKTTTEPDFNQIPFFPLFCHRATRGFDVRDDGFDLAWPRMRSQGYQFRGAYHWLEPRRIVGESVPIPPRMQAELHLDTVLKHGPLQKGEFLYVDIEGSPSDSTHVFEGGASWPTIEDCEEYVSTLEEKLPGRVGVYVGYYAIDPNNRPYREWVKQRGLFWILAWYLAADGTDSKFDAVNPTGFQMRQWTGAATVAGMPTKVDMNHVADWAALCKVAGLLDVTQ